MVDRAESLDAAARRREAAVAGHLGDEIAARAHLGDPGPSVRATALGALARLDRLEIADLERGLGDPSPLVRRRSLRIAATWPTDAGEVSIIALLDDDDDSVVEVAAWCCGERPATAGVVDRLKGLTLDHPDALVREASVAALGAIGDPAGLPTILAATKDKATVRRRAVIALAPFEGPEVTDALERARSDRDWQVRQAAEDLLDQTEDG